MREKSNDERARGEGRRLYGASKAALINLSRFIATQYGKQGVRSNAIAIGFVLSDNAIETVPQAAKDILLAHHLNPELGARSTAPTLSPSSPPTNRGSSTER